MKVLVIDDEEMIRSLARKILERAGHEVVVAESGQIALKLLSEQYRDIELIILDLRMQGLSGVETLRLIRQISPHVPCIISSGQITDQRDLPEELNVNIQFLQKPYRASALADLADSTLANRKEVSTCREPALADPKNIL